MEELVKHVKRIMKHSKNIALKIATKVGAGCSFAANTTLTIVASVVVFPLQVIGFLGLLTVAMVLYLFSGAANSEYEFPKDFIKVADAKVVD